MSYNKKRILVTGGAGLLGSHLCDVLLKDGHEVVCLDNFYTGIKQNINHLLNNSSFELLRHDVTFPLHIEVDQIFNLACPASPVHYQYDPVKTIKTSIHGAINMLDFTAKRLNIKIFLKHQHLRFMVIQKYILNLSLIGVRLTPLASDLVMMKVRDVQKLYSLIIIVNMELK